MCSKSNCVEGVAPRAMSEPLALTLRQLRQRLQSGGAFPLQRPSRVARSGLQLADMLGPAIQYRQDLVGFLWRKRRNHACDTEVAKPL
jgi:hypothetical protein